MSHDDRLLRRPEVEVKIGLARSTIYRFVAHPVPWTQVCLTRRA